MAAYRHRSTRTYEQWQDQKNARCPECRGLKKLKKNPNMPSIDCTEDDYVKCHACNGKGKLF